MDLFPESFQNFPPLARMALAFFILLVVPMLCRRISLPQVAATLAAGKTIRPMLFVDNWRWGAKVYQF
jgi:Kef-type K+ transport system membrane component KefB